MKKLIILIVVVAITCINVTAQVKLRQELKGDKFFFRYSFDKAIVSYNRTKQLTSEGQRRLAEAYHSMGLNIKSEAEYSRLMNSTGVILPEDYLNYAMVLKINGKMNEANKSMDTFAALKPNDLRAKSYIANKDKINIFSKDDGTYKIHNLNVNKNADDFGTVYYKNSIVFTSTRSKYKMIVRKYNWTGKPFGDMYIAEIDKDQLKKPKFLEKSLNDKMHEGPASFSNDGNHIAFTRNNYNLEKEDMIVNLEIYFSTYVDEMWSNPEPFILNNKDYSVGHPCLTDNGNTMYFVSDMPGGFGGADIYRISKNENGKWGKAENLGNNINTEGDELFPFFEEKSGTLYFTSNGHWGLGGLDIYVSPIDGLGFCLAQNAGYPLNTEFDDFAVIINDKMSRGYFSSNRSGGSGGDDIYSFDLLKQPESCESKVMFLVVSPENILKERTVRETFPIHNYVFFNKGSTKIPDRYVLLEKSQVKEFKEEQVELFTPKNMSGRSQRQMTIYYNVLNILGDRMIKNPSTRVRLEGASMEGIEDGLEMAENVKLYLINIFGIESSRIKTEGRIKPRIPSEQYGGINELELLREGDRRVSIWSESSDIMMEFQSGTNAPLKPVEFNVLLTAPIESYVSFNVEGANEVFNSWSLEIKDMKGEVQFFGPYYQEKVSIPGKSILGVNTEGNYKVTMIGNTKNGNTVVKDTTVHMVLWAPSVIDNGMRFSIIYEFNDSKAILIYEKYINEIVIPMIPQNGIVIIHGYTDIIGDKTHNLNLSLSRANDVKQIMDKGLAKIGRRDVTFEVYGFGEDENVSQFENKLPEERFYNRTVIIDIVPKY